MKFNELELAKGNKLLVVDSLNLCFRYKQSRRNDFSSEFNATVNSLAASYGCDSIVLLGDAGSKYRKEIYPLYKANRDEKKAKQTPQEKEDFDNFFKAYLHCWDNAPFPKLRFAGCEADDIAGYIATKLKKDFEHIWLISSDKDWSLLTSDKVSQFSSVTRKEYTVDTFEGHQGCEIDDYITVKCLQGDSGDNVPGVPMIGPKRAIELVEKYGSIWDIIEELPISGTAKYIKNLNEFGKEQLALNYELMALGEFNEEMLGEENMEKIKEVINAFSQ